MYHKITTDNKGHSRVMSLTNKKEIFQLNGFNNVVWYIRLWWIHLGLADGELGCGALGYRYEGIFWFIKCDWNCISVSNCNLQV